MKQYGKPVKDELVDWGVIWSANKYKLADDLLSIRVTFTGTEPNVSAIVQATYLESDDCH